MLILGRKPGEYLVIGDVVIKVVKDDSGLKLAVDAPKDVSIVRGEVYELSHPRPSCIAGGFTPGPARVFGAPPQTPLKGRIP